jgi:hypothetical protein
MRISGGAALIAVTVLGYLGCYLGSEVSTVGVDGGAAGPSSTAPQTTPACGGDPTLASIQDTVFNKGCAFASCHGAANPAAGLDLSPGHACASLVGQPSCVFSRRTRVVPGHPEQSYLYAKIAGKDLGTSPDGTCAGLTNGTPLRMPLGGDPLCQAAIDQVAAWITAGAQCGTPPAADAGPQDTGTDAPPDTGPSPLSLAAQTSVLTGGESTMVTLSLAVPAPAGGRPVKLSVSDSTGLASPGETFVPAGAVTASFLVTALRPSRVTLIADTAELAFVVTGLVVSELLYDDNYGNTSGAQWVKLRNTTTAPIDLGSYSLGAGQNSYAEVSAQLTGTLAAGACAVIGGPTTRYANGSPHFTQVLKFTPALPSNGTGAGIAVFDRPASALTAASLPLDAFVYGNGNPGGLLRPDGTVAVPDAPSVYLPGDSWLKTTSGWVDTYPTTPNECP